MSQWKHKVQLKDLLGEETDDHTVRTTASKMAARLRKTEFKDVDSQWLEEIVEEFEDIADSGIPASEITGRGRTLCDYFNSVLGALYDWADAERVWID